MLDLANLTEGSSSVLESFRLDDKGALVVGGTRGLGQAMAVALGAAGADVCVVGRGPAGLRETADAVTSLGCKGSYYAADVTDEANVKDMVSFVVDTFGKIDILVNSQGAFGLQPTADFDVRTWERIINVNVKSVFLCCKHVGRVMLAQRKGKIINISSVRGFQGRAKDPAYAPSKGAVNQLTRSLSIEWGPKGINVNAIAPTFTRTELSAPFLDDPPRRSGC